MAILLILNLLAGLFFLSLSSEILMDRVLKISKVLKLSDLAIGFLVLALSTSFPELSVAVLSTLSNEPAISIGNIFGSNVADVFLVLGITFLLGRKLVLHKDSTDLLFKGLLIASAFTIFLLFTGLSQASGAVALGLFAFFVYYSLKKRVKVKLDGGSHDNNTLATDVLVFLFALAGLLLSAQFVVISVKQFALGAGISSAFIGATLVAVGTSLPELAVNLAALKRHRIDVALGNTVGSVLANLTLVLGASGIFYTSTISLLPYLLLVVFSLAAVVTLGFLFKFTQRPTKVYGVIFLAIYLLFIIASYLYQ